jgi:hypothetical protein
MTLIRKWGFFPQDVHAFILLIISVKTLYKPFPFKTCMPAQLRENFKNIRLKIYTKSVECIYAL